MEWKKREPKPTDPIIGTHLWEWVKATGIAREGENVKRVVIDIDCRQVVKVYVEKFGTRQMVDVAPPDLRGAAITIVDKDEGEITGVA